jgi:hypothetical protein
MLLATLLGLALNMSAARADIYTWTDANGRVNISNLTPPDGVTVTSVVRETPKPPVAMPLAVGSVAQPDVQMLNDRLRQLELEVELAKRQASPTVIYANAPAQAPVPYYAPQSEPTPSYDYGYGYGYGYGCDPSWFGCGFGYGYSPYWYPGIVVVRSPAFHRHDFGRGKFPMVNPLPGRGGPGPGRPPGGGSRPPGGMGMGASFARR